MEKCGAFWKTRFNDASVAKFIGWDYEIIRDGSFYKTEISKADKKVSVIIRTCQRPEVLREALISLKIKRIQILKCL